MGVRVGEVVCAGCNWLGASGHEGGGEQLDVLLFVVSDVLEVGIILGAEAGCHEVLLRHAFNAAFVESVLEMLQGEGILEDIDIGRGILAFIIGAGKSCNQQKGCRCGGSEELHALCWLGSRNKGIILMSWRVKNMVVWILKSFIYGETACIK